MVHVSQSSGQPIEEGRKKAKVIAAVWGTEVIQFLATLAFLHQDDLKKGLNSSYSSYRPGLFLPLFKIGSVPIAEG